jgi:hypothetical protein
VNNQTSGEQTKLITEMTEMIMERLGKNVTLNKRVIIRTMQVNQVNKAIAEGYNDNWYRRHYQPNHVMIEIQVKIRLLEIR